MTGRGLAAIGGGVGLLLVAWLVLRTADPADGGADGLDLGARIGSDVEYVRMDRPGEAPVELLATARGWTVNGYPAADSLVERTLGALDTLPPGRLVSRSAANHARLGLEEDTAVRVRVGPAGAPQAEFLVGEAGSDGRFVRLPGAVESYALPADALDPLAGSEDAWRDYTIVRMDTAAIHRIVIRRRGEPAAVLARASGAQPAEWNASGPGADAGWTIDETPADTAVVRVYLNVLSDLQATGFPADSFVYAADFENPAAAVDVFTSSGAGTGGLEAGSVVPDASLLFSTGLDHPDVLVRRADDPIVYALDRARANILTTAGGRFRRR